PTRSSSVLQVRYIAPVVVGQEGRRRRAWHVTVYRQSAAPSDLELAVRHLAAMQPRRSPGHPSLTTHRFLAPSPCVGVWRWAGSHLGHHAGQQSWPARYPWLYHYSGALLGRRQYLHRPAYVWPIDRKSTRLNSSHVSISYA